MAFLRTLDSNHCQLFLMVRLMKFEVWHLPPLLAYVLLRRSYVVVECLACDGTECAVRTNLKAVWHFDRLVQRGRATVLFNNTFGNHKQTSCTLWRSLNLSKKGGPWNIWTLYLTVAIYLPRPSIWMWSHFGELKTGGFGVSYTLGTTGHCSVTWPLQSHCLDLNCLIL